MSECRYLKKLADLSTLSPFVRVCRLKQEQYRERHHLKEGDAGYYDLRDCYVAGCDVPRLGCENCRGECPDIKP